MSMPKPEDWTYRPRPSSLVRRERTQAHRIRRAIVGFLVFLAIWTVGSVIVIRWLIETQK